MVTAAVVAVVVVVDVIAVEVVVVDVVVEVAVDVVVDLAQDARRSDITVRQVISTQMAPLFISTLIPPFILKTSGKPVKTQCLFCFSNLYILLVSVAMPLIPITPRAPSREGPRQHLVVSPTTKLTIP